MATHRGIWAILSTFLVLTFGIGLKADGNEFKLTYAINSFGIELYKELSKSHDNLICSGYSLSTVLNMLLVGARGNTENELLDVLGYNSVGLSSTQAGESYHKLLKQQKNKQNAYQLDVANSMWIQQSFQVLSDFKDKMTKQFFANEQEVDFTTPEATKQINTWVSDETKDKIPKLFEEPLDESTTMVLVNAMYFKGTWVTKFDKTLTEKSTFIFQNGNSRRDTDMMNLVSKFPYHESEDLDAQLLEMPYDGDDVSMVIVLPKSVDGLLRLHKQLDLRKLGAALDGLVEEKVHVKIPKFEAQSTLDLNQVLKSLGMQEAFSQRADLSGINGHKNLFVSKAIQKAVIEVNEEGTVAAAASGLEIQFKSMPINPPEEFYFTADHPFLFFIRHKPTGLLMFMGSKTTP